MAEPSYCLDCKCLTSESKCTALIIYKTGFKFVAGVKYSISRCIQNGKDG